MIIDITVLEEIGKEENLMDEEFSATVKEELHQEFPCFGPHDEDAVLILKSLDATERSTRRANSR